MHTPISPAILYWGTPVVLISTLNPDDTPNIAPMSSAWWLHQRCMLGLAAQSQTTLNLLRTKQCVLNLPSDTMVPVVNALAKTSGRKDMSPFKVGAGYRYVKDKFGMAGLEAMDSEVVRPPRVRECPVQMEAELVRVNEMFTDVEGMGGRYLALEVKILRVYVDEHLRVRGKENKVDPSRWKPLIMMFQHFFGLSGRLEESRLAEIDEERYR